MYNDRSAYNLGCFGVFRKKEDGTKYTIDDLIEDRKVTDPEIIKQMKEDYSRGFKEFCRLQSCIS